MGQELKEGVGQEWRKVVGPLGEGSAEQQGQEEPCRDGNLEGAKWKFGLFRTRDPRPYVGWGRWGHRDGEMKGQEKWPEDTWPEEAWSSDAHEGLAWARTDILPSGQEWSL